ncbi:helix-turn-helix domain-containing protein [Lysinibacillus halotolerans]|uniref:GAF domain-containing protein n=1 Tax=Lysinibacillus halotolerans TaxID=1368476 RepID=A0A3M8H1T2_9BACI|nr:helix-turn-helix domain-containing protein [Lysinibacillus halotolerans]RNC96219.1 GAF domain-containing protein [Lysinibacillus halotolerans]
MTNNLANNSYLTLSKAKKLLEINKMLTQSLKLEEVLKNLITAASELVQVTDTFMIYLYDELTGKLKIAEAIGVEIEPLKRIEFAPGESITGKVFLEKKSKLFKSEQEIDFYMSNMSEENYQFYYEGVRRQKIKSAFCVPILYQDSCLGVLIVDNFNQDGIFSDADLEVIQIIADQSAIALEHSRVYQNLLQKNEMLSNTISIHKKFYQFIIDGEGIGQILLLLETLIGSKVVHRETNLYHEDSNYYPIVRSHEILGVLELERPFETFPEFEQLIIEHACSAIALELTKNSALLEQEFHFRQEIFNQLLHDLTNSDLKRILTYLQWNEVSDIQCIIIEGSANPLWDRNKLTDKQWLVLSFENMLKSICTNSFIVANAFQLIVVLPDLKDDQLSQIINEIEMIVGKEKKVLIGIGRKTSIQQIAISYHEAIQSINYAKTTKQSYIVEYAKLGMERLFHDLEPQRIEIFIQDKIGKLLKTDFLLIDTLLSFINQNKNHKETAKALHIHGNTLYYRLRKIEDILQIDLNDEKEWVDLVIAVQLYVVSHKK